MTKALCIKVCDPVYVCLCLEYAEALTNPIKHVLDQRERQLAVLMEDNDDISKVGNNI